MRGVGELLRSARIAVAVSAALVGAACSTPRYEVTVRFTSPELATATAAVEMALVADCTGVTRGSIPASPVQRIVLRRDAMIGGLAPVPPGSHGLVAIGRDDGCRVIAASDCTTHSLTRGGSALLVLTLDDFAGDDPRCACAGGVCVGVDSGAADAGPEPDGARPDGGPSCPACAPCADCVAGACVPEDSRCAPGEFCSALVGCQMGAPCTTDPDCPDDGDVCTAERCDTSRLPAVCVLGLAPEGSSCSVASAPGTCRSGTCCTGCWTGSSCATGSAHAECGAGGAACVGCSCPTTACSVGSCVRPVSVTRVTAGYEFACALDTAGDVWCWGYGGLGSLGDGMFDELPGMPFTGHSTPLPARVMEAGPFVRVEAGEFHACAIKGDGTLWCWGENNDGQLGTGDTTDHGDPVRVAIGTDWTELWTGGGADQTCAQRPSGLHCWGEGDYGQNGDGTTSDRRTPALVPLAPSPTIAATGRYHVCAIRGGELFCWGRNQVSQLGLTGGDRSSPTRVGTASDWRAIACGEEHCCGWRDAGAFCWGDNEDGMVGDGAVGTVVSAPSPVIGTSEPWRTIVSGEDNNCAIRDDGSLWCWGENDPAKLGLPPSAGADVPVPARVGTESNWSDVALGEAFICAVRNDGELSCAGGNTFGQLATGDRDGRAALTPTCFPP